jgi:hypothetical protein
VKAQILVKDRKERAAIERAMADPEVRAFVVVVGVLELLPSDRARARVVRFVADALDELAEAEADRR